MAHVQKICLDVDYGADSVVAACVGFVEWPMLPQASRLPAVSRALRTVTNPASSTDGFVWLDGACTRLLDS